MFGEERQSPAGNLRSEGNGLEGSGSREQQSMCRNLRISKKRADWESAATAIRAVNALQSACDRGFTALIFAQLLIKQKLVASAAIERASAAIARTCISRVS